MQEPPVLGQVGAGVQATQEVATHILCSGAASAQGNGDFLELTKGSVPRTGLIVYLAEGAAWSSPVCQDLKERRCVDERTRGGR